MIACVSTGSYALLLLAWLISTATVVYCVVQISSLAQPKGSDD